MSFDPYEQTADHILLAGQKSPGIAEVLGAASIREYAVRQPPFTTGARIIYKRRELAQFSVRISLYSREDFAAWVLWRPIVDAVPDVRREAKALSIDHPLLADLDIKAVVVKEVGQLEQPRDGEWTCTIKFLESRGLPKVSLATVEGAKVEPKDPVDIKIEQLTAQAQALANE